MGLRESEYIEVDRGSSREYVMPLIRMVVEDECRERGVKVNDTVLNALTHMLTFTIKKHNTWKDHIRITEGIDKVIRYIGIVKSYNDIDSKVVADLNKFILPNDILNNDTPDTYDGLIIDLELTVVPVPKVLTNMIRRLASESSCHVTDENVDSMYRLLEYTIYADSHLLHIDGISMQNVRTRIANIKYVEDVSRSKEHTAWIALEDNPTIESVEKALVDYIISLDVKGVYSTSSERILNAVRMLDYDVIFYKACVEITKGVSSVMKDISDFNNNLESQDTSLNYLYEDIAKLGITMVDGLELGNRSTNEFFEQWINLIDEKNNAEPDKSNINTFTENDMCPGMYTIEGLNEYMADVGNKWIESLKLDGELSGNESVENMTPCEFGWLDSFSCMEDGSTCMIDGPSTEDFDVDTGYPISTPDLNDKRITMHCSDQCHDMSLGQGFYSVWNNDTIISQYNSCTGDRPSLIGIDEVGCMLDHMSDLDKIFIRDVIERIRISTDDTWRKLTGPRNHTSLGDVEVVFKSDEQVMLDRLEEVISTDILMYLDYKDRIRGKLEKDFTGWELDIPTYTDCNNIIHDVHSMYPDFDNDGHDVSYRDVGVPGFNDECFTSSHPLGPDLDDGDFDLSCSKPPSFVENTPMTIDEWYGYDWVIRSSDANNPPIYTWHVQPSPVPIDIPLGIITNMDITRGLVLELTKLKSRDTGPMSSKVDIPFYEGIMLTTPEYLSEVLTGLKDLSVDDISRDNEIDNLSTAISINSFKHTVYSNTLYSSAGMATQEACFYDLLGLEDYDIFKLLSMEIPLDETSNDYNTVFNEDDGTIDITIIGGFERTRLRNKYMDIIDGKIVL